MTSERVDLTDFQYMPLFIGRLQKSKAWLRCKRQPELAFYMLNLWLRSWHEIPAGSIENDDDVLSDAAMCSPEKWDKIRDKVLAGWEIGEDGRLRHPVVGEIADKCWADKQEYRRNKEAERLRKAAKRAQPSGGNDPDRPDMSGGCPADNCKTDDGNTPENPLKVSVSVSVRDTSKTRATEIDSDEKQRRFDLVREAMNIHPDDPSWNAIHEWVRVWTLRGADFEADVLATVVQMMSKKAKTWTPRSLNYFDETVQQNFDARVRRAEAPAPESTLPPAPFDPETAKWEARLYGYRENDAWEPQWGPEPGQPGCRVPPQLLIQQVAGAA